MGLRDSGIPVPKKTFHVEPLLIKWIRGVRQKNIMTLDKFSYRNDLH
jgi:hypothetical protein